MSLEYSILLVVNMHVAKWIMRKFSTFGMVDCEMVSQKGMPLGYDINPIESHESNHGSRRGPLLMLISYALLVVRTY